jgi:hypothetical protein
VHFDREVDGLLEGLHQLIGVEGLEEAGHVLDAQGVGALVDEFLGEFDVLGNSMERSGGVEMVAGRACGLLGGVGWRL